jgi:hypothetical protein
MVRLEAKLRRDEPLFDWVTEYGPFGDGQALYVSGVDLNTIPRTALAVLLGSAYVALVVLGLATWSPPPGEALFVPVEALALGYATFTLVVVAIAAVGYLHYRRVADDVARIAAASGAGPDRRAY